MRDLVFVSMENWDEIWRRNQFLCAGLAKRFPTTKILFTGLPIDVSHGFRRGKMPVAGTQTITPVPDYPNIFLAHPLKLVPNSLMVGRKLNEAMMRSYVRQAMQSIGIKAPILWLNPHSAVHMVNQMHECAVIYDITDDWASLAQSKTLRELTIAQDKALCSCANTVIVCSQQLFDLKRNLASNLHLVPNGVDVDHYRKVLDGFGSLPGDAATWPKPILGYTGTLHAERLDLDLIEAVARGLPHGTIVFMGPNFLREADLSRLTKFKNIVIKDAVPYQCLPDYMRAFDMCIVPHQITPFTESLNPIKLWEYLAAGKPIISTNVAGFRDYSQHIRIVTNAEDFLGAVQDLLHETPDTQRSRQVAASGHSWTSRVDTVASIIELTVRSSDKG